MHLGLDGDAVSYEKFVSGKLTRQPPTGLPKVPSLNPALFPHQRDLVGWALRRGRAAIFADTGLGKSRMQLEWARCVAEYHSRSARVLILAPLAVAAQTVGEGREMGIDVTLCREPGDVRDGVNITNYDRLHKFDPTQFVGVVLDESSIIKHHDAKTLRLLIEAFGQTPFKLCATATPSPNDYTELGTHAEFLGVCSRVEMLSEYFVHDGAETQKWRLKGHARKMFWQFVASWGAMLRSPSDLGYDAGSYSLPPLHVVHHVIAADRDDVLAAGLLFAEEASTLTERRNARKSTVESRVRECAELVNATDEPFLVWCDLNSESEALTKAIHGAVEVRGSQTADEKEERMRDFSEGRARVLVSKGSICGFGVNWQHCANVAFVGVTDSFETYYQSVRRCWRFGQKRAVHVHIYASELEGEVVRNLERKQRDAEKMSEELSRETSAVVRAEVLGMTRTTNDYAPTKAIRIPEWMTTEGELAA